MTTPQTFHNYRFPQTVTSQQLATAFQAHRAQVGFPQVFRVNPTVVNIVASWLKTQGVAAEVQPNGGTFANEVWIA